MIQKKITNIEKMFHEYALTVPTNCSGFSAATAARKRKPGEDGLGMKPPSKSDGQRARRFLY